MYIVSILTSIRNYQHDLELPHMMLNETKLPSFLSPVDFQLSSYETIKNGMAQIMQFALNTFFLLLNSSHTNSFNTESILRLRIVIIVVIIVIFTRLIFNLIPFRVVKPWMSFWLWNCFPARSLLFRRFDFLNITHFSCLFDTSRLSFSCGYFLRSSVVFSYINFIGFFISTSFFPIYL